MFEKGFQSLREEKLQRYIQYASGLALASAQRRGFQGAVRQACSRCSAAWSQAARRLPRSSTVLGILCAQVCLFM